MSQSLKHRKRIRARKRRRKRRIRRIICLFSFLIILTGFFFIWKAFHPDESADPQPTIPLKNLVIKQTVSEEETDVYLQYIVPNVMDKYNMHAIIDIEKEYQCFEDFDHRHSRQKTDHYRKWYHTRTKHPMISYEGYQENYSKKHDGQQWDEIDYTQEIEETITAKVLVDKF